MQQNQIIIASGRNHQPQVIISGNRVWYDNNTSAMAYRRQKIVAISVPLVFFVMAIVSFVFGSSLFGGIMLGISALFFLFAIFIIMRAKKRHTEMLAYNATYNPGQNQAPMYSYPPQQYPAQPYGHPHHTQPYPGQPYPGQPYPTQAPSGPIYPPQSYPTQSSSQGIQPQQQSVPSVSSGPSVEPAPPSYDEAMTNQQKQ